MKKIPYRAARSLGLIWIAAWLFTIGYCTAVWQGTLG